jgi:predicted ATPase
MIKRLFVDNFRSLVNFDIELGGLTLLLGPNGSGKTTVLDVVRRLREFVCEEGTTNDLFPASTLTRWQRRDVQVFELTTSEKPGEFTYHLEVEHNMSEQRCRVKWERLLLNGKPLFESRLKDRQLHAQLFRDNLSRGPELLTDWTRSGVGLILPRDDNMLLTGFKDWLGRVLVCRFNPMSMSARSEQETPLLDANATNFVGWLRNATSLDMEFAGRLRPMLEEILAGYNGLSLLPDGEDAKVLKIKFRAGGEPESPNSIYECRFDEISDGQRLLVILYSLLATATVQTTVCLDEPENFLALQEVQPWLNALIDRTQSQDLQAILISHHPELVDALAVGCGRWLDRAGGGPTRCQVVSQDGSGLPVSELVARGWLHG